jgi:diaminohydroxyphosphoribosylaminopyrimidine deaminase/5-amino-6-(5-phosphoribosylamino)uracil reductase
MSASLQEKDRHFMAEALQLARRIPRRPWPNPPVGAVVVRDGEIVGRGAHHGAGTAHAEIVALNEAGQAARGATLYCSLEPCNHTGRTPPCAPAVLASGVTRVVVGVKDPNPSVTGGGLRFLAENGVTVVAGLLGEQALDLIWPFVTTCAFARPFVLLKTATSLDGRFAPAASYAAKSSGPVYLTREEARRDVQRTRRWMDLILVGEGTVRSDRPRLDGRLLAATCACPRSEPAVGYADSDLSHTDGWHQESYFVFTSSTQVGHPATQSVTADGGKLVFCQQRDHRVDPLSLLEEVKSRGFFTIMVEGGPRLAASFLARGVVDRWVQYHAPVFLGHGVQWPQPADNPLGEDHREFSLTSYERIGPDLRLVFDRDSFGTVLEQVIGMENANRQVTPRGL